jgi:hypothetical protein
LALARRVEELEEIAKGAVKVLQMKAFLPLAYVVGSSEAATCQINALSQ